MQRGNPLVAQQVKNLALSLQWLRSLLWCRFEPRPRNFPMPWCGQGKKKQQQQKRQKKKKRKKWKAVLSQALPLTLYLKYLLLYITSPIISANDLAEQLGDISAQEVTRISGGKTLSKQRSPQKSSPLLPSVDEEEGDTCTICLE